MRRGERQNSGNVKRKTERMKRVVMHEEER